MIFLLRRVVVRPLEEISSRLIRLAENDLDVGTTNLTRKDEFGALSRALGVFRDNALARQSMERELQRANQTLDDKVRV